VQRAQSCEDLFHPLCVLCVSVFSFFEKELVVGVRLKMPAPRHRASRSNLVAASSASAGQARKPIREHWGIEYQQGYILDVTFTKIQKTYRTFF